MYCTVWHAVLLLQAVHIPVKTLSIAVFVNLKAYPEK